MDLINEAYSGANVIQGFIDQHGKFLTKAEAQEVASISGQIIQRCRGVDVPLGSEDLY